MVCHTTYTTLTYHIYDTDLRHMRMLSRPQVLQGTLDKGEEAMESWFYVPADLDEEDRNTLLSYYSLAVSLVASTITTLVNSLLRLVIKSMCKTEGLDTITEYATTNPPRPWPVSNSMFMAHVHGPCPCALTRPHARARPCRYETSILPHLTSYPILHLTPSYILPSYPSYPCRYETSIFAKLSISYVLNSAVMPLVVGIYYAYRVSGKLITQSWYEAGGLTHSALSVFPHPIHSAQCPH